MKNLNPFAVVFWVMCAGVGYLIGDLRGAIIGMLVGMGTSLAIELTGR